MQLCDHFKAAPAIGIWLFLAGLLACFEMKWGRTGGMEQSENW